MIARVLALLIFALAARAAGPTATELVQSLREVGLDPDACYRVRDLSYAKEDLKLYFNDGYLIFSRPVLGERLSAVFSGHVEGGDGEVLLLPPSRAERFSLAKYTQSPNLDEHFSAGLLFFTDGAAQTLLERITKGGAGKPAPEMGPSLAQEWNPVVGNLAESFAMRMLVDILNPARAGGGFFVAALAGKRLGNFDVVYDPRGADQIVAAQLVERETRPAYNIWTSFPARSHRSQPYGPPPNEFQVDAYTIDAQVELNLQLKAVTRMKTQVGLSPVRVFPFEISRAMEVSSATIDGQPAEVLRRDSPRGRPGENEMFLVAAPEQLAPGSIHEITVTHSGRVIGSPGKGVYYVGARSNWYPSHIDTSATFDLTFRHPRTLTLVTPGDLTEERTEGDWKITRHVTPRIRVAGFNLGEYERFATTTQGYNVEVYGNRVLEPGLRPPPRPTIIVEPVKPNIRAGIGRQDMTTMIPMPPVPDPLARLKTVAADVSASLQYFTTAFGPPPLKTLTVSPIPDTFGQGFPGLIYISTLAYLDPEERPLYARSTRQQTFFSDVIHAHEVAHQWWGNHVSVDNYQDDWLIEALAQYSAMLWIEKKKGPKLVETMLEEFRADLTRHDPEGHSIESFGPVTWGYRLESTPMSEAWRIITYEKGVWILHMLRQRLGTDPFLKMLHELAIRFAGKSVSTRDLQALAKEFRPPATSPEVIDNFFDNWVYNTGIPELKLKSSHKGVAPAIRLTGTVEQSGVEDDFSVDVPVEIQFAKGPSQIVWVRTAQDPVPFSVTLKQPPVRVSVLTRSGILAVSK